jgi:hypothetical protein
VGEGSTTTVAVVVTVQPVEALVATMEKDEYGCTPKSSAAPVPAIGEPIAVAPEYN